MAEIVCLGEALIDFVALESGVEVGEASGFFKAPGGAPANVAVGVSRLGHTSSFLGKVGDDPFGHFLEQTFSRAGVDTGGMVFSPERRTGLAFVSLAANGERDFCFFRNPSADMTYQTTELDRQRLLKGKIFHYGSITLIDEPARTTTLAAVSEAQNAGLLISCDPNLRIPLWPDLETARKGILESALTTDIIKVSGEELRFVLDAGESSGESSDELSELAALAERWQHELPQLALIVVTCGAWGCLWRTRAGAFGSVDGFQVDPMDTTGAGDGFVAALLTGLIEANWTSADAIGRLSRDDLEPILRRANAVGALTTTRRGAIPSLPTRAETDIFLTQATPQNEISNEQRE